MIGRVRWGPLRAGSHLDVAEVPVVCPRLPPSLEGLRIALLADLHYGKCCRDEYVRRVFERALELRSDLIVMCGDMVHTPVGPSARLGRIIRPYAARAAIHAVRGNHDCYFRPDAYPRAMASAGVDVLINEHRILRPRPGGEAVALVGMDDLRWGRPDFDAAVDGVGADVFTIVAGHNPDLADRLPPRARVDLMLAGHTHGGQIRLLGFAPVTFVRNRSYVSGLVPGPGFPVYISRGLGYTALPLRIGADPELPILTLRGNPG